jgi:hypothetical protein
MKLTDAGFDRDFARSRWWLLAGSASCGCDRVRVGVPLAESHRGIGEWPLDVVVVAAVPVIVFLVLPSCPRPSPAGAGLANAGSETCSRFPPLEEVASLSLHLRENGLYWPSGRNSGIGKKVALGKTRI